MRNRILMTLLLVALSCACAFAQTIATVAKGTPFNSSDVAITGLVPLATPTLTFGATDVAKRMTPLPANTVAVTVIASGAVNYGSSSVVADTVSTAHYLKLVDGGEKTFNIYPGTQQPDIWFVPTATGATNVGVRFIAHVQR
jgi:hypothetical protein